MFYLLWLDFGDKSVTYYEPGLEAVHDWVKTLKRRGVTPKAVELWSRPHRPSTYHYEQPLDFQW